MTWCDMPTVLCPHCDQEFQLDDYWEVEPDYSFECEKCGKEIFVHNVKTILTVCLEKYPFHPKGD